MQSSYYCNLVNQEVMEREIKVFVSVRRFPVNSCVDGLVRVLCD